MKLPDFNLSNSYIPEKNYRSNKTEVTIMSFSKRKIAVSTGINASFASGYISVFVGLIITLDLYAPDRPKGIYVFYSCNSSADKNKIRQVNLEEKGLGSSFTCAVQIIAKELVQKINAQNNYDAEPTGDEISSAKWLKEKLAEIIHRDEDRIELYLGFTLIVEEILDLIDTTGNGIQDWIANDQYPNAYLAICFYKSEIQAEGYSCGVKHVNRWIKAQFVVYNSSVSSRLYAYLHTSLSSWVFTNNQEFLEICWVRSLIEYVADSTGHRCKCRLC